MVNARTVNIESKTAVTKAAVLRVVLDECVSPDSILARRFRASLRPGQQFEFCLLSKAHRGIPDSDILRRLLGHGTVLLTQDRVLHNQACKLGLTSFTLDSQGELMQKQ